LTAVNFRGDYNLTFLKIQMYSLNAYELLDWASSLGLERKIPVNLSAICSILDINIIQRAFSALGSIDINKLGKIEIRLNSEMVYSKERFVIAMLLGHYWRYLGQPKTAIFSKIEFPKYEITQIVYPCLSFKHSYEEFAYSLFASQLVMPSSAVNTLLNLSKGKRPSLFKMIHLARGFQVPLNVMIQRIETLSLR
jgi:Zn-dependent peptidase ImmA (M78 family)